jgi:hypothetical protein
MSYTPCVFARQWPQLWERLPDDDARCALSQSVASARLQGWDPTPEAVTLLVDAAVGDVPQAAVVAALVSHAQQADAQQADAQQADAQRDPPRHTEERT